MLGDLQGGLERGNIKHMFHMGIRRDLEHLLLLLRRQLFVPLGVSRTSREPAESPWTSQTSHKFAAHFPETSLIVASSKSFPDFPRSTLGIPRSYPQVSNPSMPGILTPSDESQRAPSDFTNVICKFMLSTSSPGTKLLIRTWWIMCKVQLQSSCLCAMRVSARMLPSQREYIHLESQYLFDVYVVVLIFNALTKRSFTYMHLILL